SVRISASLLESVPHLPAPRCISISSSAKKSIQVSAMINALPMSAPPTFRLLVLDPVVGRLNNVGTLTVDRTVIDDLTLRSGVDQNGTTCHHMTQMLDQRITCMLFAFLDSLQVPFSCTEIRAELDRFDTPVVRAVLRGAVHQSQSQCDFG